MNKKNAEGLQGNAPRNRIPQELIDLFPYPGLQMNKKMQRDFKGTPFVTESLKN
jgi:hypothetical protein